MPLVSLRSSTLSEFCSSSSGFGWCPACHFKGQQEKIMRWRRHWSSPGMMAGPGIEKLRIVYVGRWKTLTQCVEDSSKAAQCKTVDEVLEQAGVFTAGIHSVSWRRRVGGI